MLCRRPEKKTASHSSGSVRLSKIHAATIPRWNDGIDDESLETDQEIEQKLFEGLKPFLPKEATLESFKSSDESQFGIMSSA